MLGLMRPPPTQAGTVHHTPQPMRQQETPLCNQPNFLINDCNAMASTDHASIHLIAGAFVQRVLNSTEVVTYSANPQACRK